MAGDDIERALAEAKRLEAEEPSSDEEIAERYEKDMERATGAAKLLKRAAYLREPVSRRKKTVKKRSK